MKSPFLNQWYWNFQQFSQGPFARTSKKTVLEQTAVRNRPVFSITWGEEIFTEVKIREAKLQTFYALSQPRSLLLIPCSHMQEPHFPLAASLKALPFP